LLKNIASRYTVVKIISESVYLNIRPTKRRGRVVTTPASYSAGLGIKSRPGDRHSFFFFSVPVCAITVSGVPGGTLVSMNRFSTLCG
jgi:hypothetical protein